MKNQTKIFQPLKPKTDRMTCAYLGQDGSAITIWERRTELGTQKYCQVATKIPNLHISTHGAPTRREDMTPQGALRRIVLHKPAILAVPLAAGKPVSLEVWYNNSSDRTRDMGLRVESLSIECHGIGYYTLSQIPGVSCSGFDLQWMGSDGFDRDISQQTADSIRAIGAKREWDLDTRVLRFEDHENADAAAA